MTYQVSVEDAEDPAPTVECQPASATIFAIGTTTVTCTGADGAGNETVETFTVHVKSAVEQLEDLAAALVGVGPRSSLSDRALLIRDKLVEGDVNGACNNLTGAYPQLVNSQTGKKLSQAQADAILADIARIAAVVGCT